MLCGTTIAALALVLTLTAHVLAESSVTETEEEALLRIDRLLHEIVDHAPDGYGFHREQVGDTASGCAPAVAGRPAGQVRVGLAYRTWVVAEDGGAPAEVSAFFDAVEDSWTGRASRSTVTAEAGRVRRDRLTGLARGDYLVTLAYDADRATLRLSGRSPCIWPEGVPLVNGTAPP